MIQISSKGTPIQLFVRITRSVKKKVNQYYIWNVKMWYGVPTASSGKCWRKYMMKMADMWYYIKQMKRSTLESVFIFRGRVIGLDNYKSKNFMSRPAMGSQHLIHLKIQKILQTQLLNIYFLIWTWQKISIWQKSIFNHAVGGIVAVFLRWRCKAD